MTKKVPRSTTARYYIGLDIYGSTISNACAAAGGSAPVQQIVLEAWSGRHDSPLESPEGEGTGDGSESIHPGDRSH